MKWQDVAFIILVIIGLYVLNLDKEVVKGIISGVVIGVYATWRIKR